MLGTTLNLTKHGSGVLEALCFGCTQYAHRLWRQNREDKRRAPEDRAQRCRCSLHKSIALLPSEISLYVIQTYAKVHVFARIRRYGCNPIEATGTAASTWRHVDQLYASAPARIRA